MSIATHTHSAIIHVSDGDKSGLPPTSMLLHSALLIFATYQDLVVNHRRGRNSMFHADIQSP